MYSKHLQTTVIFMLSLSALICIDAYIPSHSILLGKTPHYVGHNPFKLLANIGGGRSITRSLQRQHIMSSLSGGGRQVLPID